MYQPKHFEQADKETLRTLIHAYPLATLVVHDGSQLVANPMPCLLAGDVLRAHIARANPLWTTPITDPALFIFQGPNGYVSPNWYPSKLSNPSVVPTWNYAVVHLHGHLRFIEERAWLRRFITEFTERHERTLAHPWQVNDAPEGYVEQLLGHIVGIEMQIERWEGKWKLSQNRSDADRQAVISAHARQNENLAQLERLSLGAGTQDP